MSLGPSPIARRRLDLAREAMYAPGWRDAYDDATVDG